MKSTFLQSLISALFMNFERHGLRQPAIKHYGGSYRNNRNHGNGRRRKNPFRGTTCARVIGVSSHIN